MQSLVSVLRANSALAAWVGTDALSDVKVYWGMPPGLDDLDDTATGYRFVRIDLMPGGVVEWTYGEQKLAEAVVQIMVVDRSSDPATQVIAGERLVAAALEPPSTASLDGANVSGWETRGIFCQSGLRTLEEEDGAMNASRDWRIYARKATT